MNVIEMVSKYLKDHGAEGLCNIDLECGCRLHDLAPCGEIQGDCVVASNSPLLAKKEGGKFFMVPMDCIEEQDNV